MKESKLQVPSAIVQELNFSTASITVEGLTANFLLPQSTQKTMLKLNLIHIQYFICQRYLLLESGVG